jgi:hypothetical protein
MYAYLVGRARSEPYHGHLIPRGINSRSGVTGIRGIARTRSNTITRRPQRIFLNFVSEARAPAIGFVCIKPDIANERKTVLVVVADAMEYTQGSPQLPGRGPHGIPTCRTFLSPLRDRGLRHCAGLKAAPCIRTTIPRVEAFAWRF